MLEEDLRTGGGGIPVGEEDHGAGLDGLDGRRGKGPGPGPHVSLAERRGITLLLNPLGTTPGLAALDLCQFLFRTVYGIPDWLLKKRI